MREDARSRREVREIHRREFVPRATAADTRGDASMAGTRGVSSGKSRRVEGGDSDIEAYSLNWFDDLDVRFRKEPGHWGLVAWRSIR